MIKGNLRNAVDILWDEFYEGKPDRQKDLEKARLNCEIAGMVYDLREELGLTQAELAKRVGTTQSVISRLEAQDYEGHSLSMLYRIASACGKRLKIEFDEPKEATSASS